MKIITASFLASLIFMVFAIKTYLDGGDGPFFIDSSAVFSHYEPMISANRLVGQMDGFVQKKMAVFDDSISKVLDSLSAGNPTSGDLLELLNMESNVLRHKMMDSVTKVTAKIIANTNGRLDAEVSIFCRRNGIETLLGTPSNFVVYGAEGKADRTAELLDFIGVVHE